MPIGSEKLKGQKKLFSFFSVTIRQKEDHYWIWNFIHFRYHLFIREINIPISVFY